MKYDITVGLNSEVSIVTNTAAIKKGIGFNPRLNEAVLLLYNELQTAKKSKPTIGIGYSEYMGFKNLSIYEVV